MGGYDISPAIITSDYFIMFFIQHLSSHYFLKQSCSDGSVLIARGNDLGKWLKEKDTVIQALEIA